MSIELGRAGSAETAKRFYQGLGWRLYIDLVLGDDVRTVKELVVPA
jgi:hypothetical protein